ncbi:MAG: hypothetical protein MK106_10110 [Mariniblastus sp.]|nr:hypothetical protein [Mariniblastus sp.]
MEETKKLRIAWRWLVTAIIALASVVAGYVYVDYNRVIPEEVRATYVGRSSCIECHQTQADLFHGSHHDLAMDLASDETVLAKFDGTEIPHYGVTSTVFRDGEKFMVNTEGPDGEMQDFEVKYVFGVEPLQQYMVELRADPEAKEGEIGQLQVLRLSWDTKKKRWFYLTPPDVDEKIESNDPLHWTGITQRWNTSCAECHSTDLQRNYDTVTQQYHTTFSEIDVSCEACHGPGSVHVELAQNKKFFWDKNRGYGLANLKTVSNVPQVESCAPCHSRRTGVCNGFQAGDRFDNFFACQVLSDQIYQDDGQIRDEDYVYGSFIQSKMFHKGIRCTDCHDPHSTKLKYNDNRLCTSCHQHPAGKYDSVNHHHHEMGTPGASCVECHMPSTTYMEVDSRRDHSLRVPRPDMSVKYGTPNACTGCHIDKSKLDAADQEGLKQYLDWLIQAELGNPSVASELERVNQQMLDAVDKWYGKDAGAPPKSKYYEQLAAGKSGSPESPQVMMQLAVDSTAPAIFRATALQELSEEPSTESLATAVQATQDEDPKVVSAALARIDTEVSRILQRSTTATELNQQLEPLVEIIVELTAHPFRRVRITAAAVAASIPSELRNRWSNPDGRRSFEKAIQEYRDSLLLENDRPRNHLMLGSIYELLNQSQEAMEAYRAAVRLDPYFAGPRANLAALLESDARQMNQQMRSSGNQVSVAELRQITQQIQASLKEAAALRQQEHELLVTDIRRSKGLPNTHALFYRYAMSCYIQNELDKTEEYLMAAYQQAPDVPQYLLALATFYRQQKDYSQAVKFVNELLAIDDQNPSFRNLAKELSIELEAQPVEPAEK